MIDYPTPADLDDSWNAGYEGFLSGDFQEDNPYSVEDEFALFQSWEEGWMTASESTSEGYCGCEVCACDD